MGFFLLSGSALALPVSVSAPELSSHTVTLTAYNAVPEQTDDTPLETASGAYANPEIIAARSQNLAKKLPFGTIIKIDGNDASGDSCGYDIVKPIVGYRIIADTMNARFTDRVDILFSTKSNYVMANGKTKNAGAVLGICNGATVRVVGFVNLNKTRNIPKTQAELVAIVNGTKNSLAFK